MKTVLQQVSHTASGADRARPSPNGFKFGWAGLLTRKERWGLTWRGRVMVLLLMVGSVSLCIWRVHPFLAVTKPVEAEWLVVEGWIPDYGLNESLALSRTRPTRKIFTVGGPVGSAATPVADDDTYAYVAAKRLIRLGADAGTVEMIPNSAKDRERTYSSAVALREWLVKNKLPAKSINVVTLGPHARRTRLLYEHAFGDDTKVGVISIRHQGYHPDRWWQFSEGVKEVTSETVAYLYTLFAY